jgi:glucose/arabinose dehydrogenase
MAEFENIMYKNHNKSIFDRKVSRKLEKRTGFKVKNWTFVVLTISLIYSFSLFMLDEKALGQNQLLNTSANNTGVMNLPTIFDPTLKVETIATGFDFPTSIDFLGDNDLLLLEKNTGKVLRIVDGNVSKIVIQLNVSLKDERGLLGLAITENDRSKKGDRFVFLYYTYCPKVKGQERNSQNCGNYVHRYSLNSENSELTDPKLILTLPALPGPSHNGGVLLLDDDENLYVTTGDLQSTAFNKNQTGFDTKAQNILNGTSPDGRAGILRLTVDGDPVGNGVLGTEYPLDLYYAYGVKNSFGIGIDPVTGSLWDTENGPKYGDEVNLVEEGFNSGWEKVQGIWRLNQTKGKDVVFDEANDSSMLVNFNGKGKYSSPEFVWDKPVGPTALIFLASDKLGKDYENDILVGSVKNGVIYHFDLDKNRKTLVLNGDVEDSVLEKKDDSTQIIFGENFGIVTDMEVGPDGFLYILSGNRSTDDGAIYRIVPRSANSNLG